MDFKRQPFINDWKIPLQPFDNTFADIAEGSDIVGIDGHLDWVHPALLCGCNCLPFFTKPFTWLLILSILYVNQVLTYK